MSIIKKSWFYIVVILAVVLVGWLYYKLQSGDRVSFFSVFEVLTQDESEVYRDPDYVFSFQYDKGYLVNTMEEGDIKIIRVENNDRTIGCQMAVSDFDEELEYITSDRIRRDLPHLQISAEEYQTIADDVRVFKFVLDDNGRASREAWFLSDKVLYQISCTESAGGLQDRILSSMHW